VFWFPLQLLSETFLILRRTERYMIKTVHRSASKAPDILVSFNETWIFSTDFRKILKYQIPWKSVHWQPSCPMCKDGRTHIHDEAKSLFSHFCERASKDCYVEARSTASRRLSLPVT
jgi:hypothetical protein